MLTIPSRQKLLTDLSRTSLLLKHPLFPSNYYLPQLISNGGVGCDEVLSGSSWCAERDDEVRRVVYVGADGKIARNRWGVV